MSARAVGIWREEEMTMNRKHNYGWSIRPDGDWPADQFGFATRDAALQGAMDAGHVLPIATGRSVKYVPCSGMLAGAVIDQAEADADGTVGEVADGWPYLTDKQREALGDVIRDVLLSADPPTFSQIVAVRDHTDEGGETPFVTALSAALGVE